MDKTIRNHQKIKKREKITSSDDPKWSQKKKIFLQRDLDTKPTTPKVYNKNIIDIFNQNIDKKQNSIFAAQKIIEYAKSIWSDNKIKKNNNISDLLLIYFQENKEQIKKNPESMEYQSLRLIETKWEKIISLIIKKLWINDTSIENFIETTTVNQKKIDFLDSLMKELENILKRKSLANKYLFDLVQSTLNGQFFPGVYKITITRKESDFIECKIQNTNKSFFITLKKSDIYNILNKDAKNKKTKQELNWIYDQELKKNDSVMLISDKDKIATIIDPDDIIKQVLDYNKSTKDQDKEKKIDTLLWFFVEWQNQDASWTLDSFYRFMKTKLSKRKKTSNNKLSEEEKKYFFEVIKRFIKKHNMYFHQWKDIDKSAIQLLLNITGIPNQSNIKDVSYEKLDTIQNWIFVDIKQTKSWIESDKQWKIVISEHGNNISSSTYLIYKLLLTMWAIDKKYEDQINRFVRFVNIIDSMDYQLSPLNYDQSHKTLFGLHRLLPINFIYNYFKDPSHTWFEILPDVFLRNNSIRKNWETKTLYDISQTHRQRIQNNKQIFNQLKQQKKSIKISNIIGKNNWINFIIDLKKDKNRDAEHTAGYYWYGVFKIGPERGNIYIYSPYELPSTIKWYKTSGNFLIINNPTQDDLDKILEIFDKEDATQETKKQFEQNKKEIQEYFNTIHKKIEQKNLDPIRDIAIFQKKLKTLPTLHRQDLIQGKEYKWVINNVANKYIYISLDNKQLYNWRIVLQDRKQSEQFQKWAKISVIIQEIINTPDKTMLTLTQKP